MWTRFYYQPTGTDPEVLRAFHSSDERKLEIDGMTTAYYNRGLNQHYIEFGDSIDCVPDITVRLDVYRVSLVRRNIKPTSAVPGMYYAEHVMWATVEETERNGRFVQNIDASILVGHPIDLERIDDLHKFHSRLCKGELAPNKTW